MILEQGITWTSYALMITAKIFSDTLAASRTIAQSPTTLKISTILLSQ